MKKACEVGIFPEYFNRAKPELPKFSKQYNDWLSNGESAYNFCYENNEFNPCFVSSCKETQGVPEDEIPFFLEMAMEDLSDDSLLFFSVTSLEKNHKAWLEAIEGYPGAAVYEHDRGRGNTFRTVYTCIVPVTPKL